MKHTSKLALALAAAIGSAGLPAAAQNTVTIAPDVGQPSFAAEIACRETLRDISVNTDACFEGLEDAIQALAGFQLYMIENSANIHTGEAYGTVGDEVMVPPAQITEGTNPKTTLLKSVLADTAGKLDLDVSSQGVGGAIDEADYALTRMFHLLKVREQSVHSEAGNIVGLLQGLYQQHQAQPDFTGNEPG